jgi:hypothetical protein
MALGALVYWFYFNYFSRIELNKPAVEENTNINQADNPKIMSGEISQIQGDVQVNISQKGFEKAIDKAVLHQGDSIKTGENSLAVLALADGTKIRVGADSEIILNNLDEKNILVELLRGRIYNNISTSGQYQIKSLQALMTSLGTKFDVMTNDVLQTVAVTVIENKVKLEILNQDEIIMSSRLDANEKAFVDLKAAKKDMLKISTVDQKVLAKDQWYKWNFDQDQGIADNLPDQEPDFQEVTDSLDLTAEENDQGINLTWTEYNQDNFQAYKIMWSTTDSGLKYPGSEIVKSLADKTRISYLDTKILPNKKYYYRICVVKVSNKVACGNVIEITTAEKDSTPPSAPILSATIGIPGVDLTWTANNENDFVEYRVLKSMTDANPSFPTAGYLVKKLKGDEKYLDAEVNITTPFSYYYRVCSLDSAQNSSCSNVITVENGVVK